MMTQFFQVLKHMVGKRLQLQGFMMTQFFQVLKQAKFIKKLRVSFMMTQFFQVLKPQIISFQKQNFF